MRHRLFMWTVGLTVGVAVALPLAAREKSPVERGWEATHESFNSSLFSRHAYDNGWKAWGLAAPPNDYLKTYRDRYGLHEAPYSNKGLPMGLHEARGPFGAVGIGNDCLLCHAGSVAGRTVIGLGNASVDLQGLYEEMADVDGMRGLLPNLRFSLVRGTIEAAPAVVYLMQFRDAELNLRVPVNLRFDNHSCEDIPAWWHLKRKKTMYATGATDSRSVKSLMAFLLSPLNSGEFIKKQEAAFRDIQSFILSLEPPKYPFAVEQKLAAQGKELFVVNCVRCHGTYGPGGRYPNKIVPLETIGTDAALAAFSYPESTEHFLKSWIAHDQTPEGEALEVSAKGGYQAPPLDGIWATAPYFHNGSVPTVYHVLNSRARPRIHTRSFRTGVEDYDAVKLGWKFTSLAQPSQANLSPAERRKIYDTTQPGRGNSGHTFGDKLSEQERMAVIEYLKTI